MFFQTQCAGTLINEAHKNQSHQHFSRRAKLLPKDRSVCLQWGEVVYQLLGYVKLYLVFVHCICSLHEGKL